jgi:hypothetical protein
MSVALGSHAVFALRAELDQQAASPPVWTPRLRGALTRLDLYFDHRFCGELAALLDEDWLVDRLRVIHGPAVRTALPPLFVDRDVAPTHAARAWIDVDADEPMLRVADARDELTLAAGRHLEWLYTRPWFIDEVIEKELPAIRVSLDEIAALDGGLHRLFQRVLDERQYQRASARR